MSTGPAWRDAKWCVHEDGAQLQLQLELGNGCTVLLAGWKEDGELDVALHEAGASMCATSGTRRCPRSANGSSKRSARGNN